MRNRLRSWLAGFFADEIERRARIMATNIIESEEFERQVEKVRQMLAEDELAKAYNAGFMACFHAAGPELGVDLEALDLESGFQVVTVSGVPSYPSGDIREIIEQPFGLSAPTGGD